MTWRHDLEVHDARLPGERRPDGDGPADLRRGVDAVEQDARPHHVEVALRELEDGARVGDVAHGRRRALLVVPREDLAEARELDARGFEIRGVGIREVGVDALHDGVPALGRPLEEAARVVVVHADPLHARVDLQVHLGGDPHVAGDRLDVAELVDGRRGERQSVAQEHGDLIAEDAPHDQDGDGDAGLAEGHGLLEEGGAERRRAEGDEMARDLDQAMPIGIGLDDRHHDGRADGGLDGAEVLGEARQADLDDGRPQDAGVERSVGSLTRGRV